MTKLASGSGLRTQVVNTANPEDDADEMIESDQILRDGYRAYFNNESQESNPHETNSIAYEFWSDGWEDGYDDERNP